MAGASRMWWEDPATDWSAGDPARVADVLAFAYGTPEDARRIALKAGVDWSGAPDAASVRETWTWALTEAAAAGRVLDLAAVVLHDPDSSEFHALLSRLLGDRLGEVNARLVLRYGLPPAPSVGSDSVVESIVEAEPPAGASGGELQAITSVRAGIDDPRARIQAVRDLMVRTALIEVAGRPAGTGFLVGEDLVLTAAHVLDALRWPPDPLRPAEAVFDFEYSGRSPAETGTRVPVAEFVTGSLPTAAEAAGSVTDDWDAPEDRLDFALLRLATAVPQRPDAEPGTRGYYALSEEDYDFGANAQYMIMEHPLGGFVRLSEFSGLPLVSAGRTRIRYGGNTLAGASGSAVVDYRGRLVGLHHYAGGGHNQGVPISIIARTLLPGDHAGLFRDGAPVAASAAVTRVDPFATSAVLRRRPFVNRQNLRETMRDMAEQRAGTRTLAINGESGTGVSYSYMLASHVAEQSTLCDSLRAAAPGGLKVLRIDLRAYLNVPVERVRAEIGTRLLMELGIVDSPTDPLAQEARDTLNLVATLGARLRRSDPQWWFFFDSIDNPVAVKQGEVDELIHALIELADDVQVPLRIVLAGRAAEEFASEHTGWAERDSVAGLTRGDVDGWLRQRALEESATIDEARLEARLTELFPAPGPLPEPRVLGPKLLRVLIDVVRP